MEIKAIYLPDLAFDSSKGGFTFVYDPNTKRFVMESDREVSYSEDSVLEDIESWLLFSTQLLVDDDGTSYGECKQINREEFKMLKAYVILKREGKFENSRFFQYK